MRRTTLVSITTILILMWPWHSLGQQERIDSMNKILDTAGIVVKANTLTELAWTYRNINPEKGVESGEQALELLYRIGDKRLEAECLLYIGACYFQMNNLNDAMDNFLKSMKIKEELNDREGIAALLNNLGNISKEMGNYSKAIEYYLQARELGEQLENPRITSTALANLAVNYKILDDYEKALEYNREALRIREEIGDRRGVAGSLNNIAIIYADSAYTGVDLKKALKYFQQSLEIKQELEDHYGISQTYINMGQLYTDLGRTKDALPLFQQALRLARELKATNIVMACYAHLSQYYEKTGNYKEALRYQIIYTNMMDSVYIEENKQEMAEMMVRFETDKKEKENELLKQQSEIQTLQIRRQRTLRNFFIILAVLLLLLAATYISRYVLKHRTNRLLEEKNKQLALLNATKDKFFSIIAHDLKNPFGTLLQVSDQLKERYSELNDEQKLQIISLINKSALLTHDLLANLLEWSVSQTGDVPHRPEKVDFSAVVDECMALLKLNAEKKGVRLISAVSGNTYVYADRNMVATVMRNLLSNAIKYMEKEGEVRVDSHENDQMIEVMVKDDGIGISKEDIEKLFRIDFNTRNIGKSREKGTGLGLILCREFVEKNGGTIWVESETGKGSIFTFTLPKEKN